MKKRKYKHTTNVRGDPRNVGTEDEPAGSRKILGLTVYRPVYQLLKRERKKCIRSLSVSIATISQLLELQISKIFFLTALVTPLFGS